jgi:hypothetical protein
VRTSTSMLTPNKATKIIIHYTFSVNFALNFVALNAGLTTYIDSKNHSLLHQLAMLVTAHGKQTISCVFRHYLRYYCLHCSHSFYWQSIVCQTVESEVSFITVFKLEIATKRWNNLLTVCC